ncbi:MAG: CopG family transcriptional regulator [Dethiobacteria bacterium]
MKTGRVDVTRGPGRPEIGPPVIIRLPEELIRELDRRAEAKGISRAEVVRRLLAEALYGEQYLG